MKGIIFICIFFISFLSLGQADYEIQPPDREDFAGIISFLASDWMEGREAGKQGSFMAADFIAAMMELNGLKPYAHKETGDHLFPFLPGFDGSLQKSYFQDFTVIDYHIEKSGNLTLILGKPDSLSLRNVIGMIPGKDSTRSIVIGAHYDHLGISGGQTFNGADDNASGVAGMLALAGHWSRSPVRPPVNMIFAAWTAEETGKFGSRYFVQRTGVNPGNTLVSINMDMISRSAPEDTLRRILSIGTMPAGEDLRTLAGKVNSKLGHPFDLDLWDVTGHSGSDYAPFVEVNVPVMTFFSGFQEDYHTPRDDASRVDLEKMRTILALVNDILTGLMERVGE